MSEILTVSDIHIHDYSQRNPFEKARLLQTRIVAQNIIEVGKKEGADIIVFAGDVLEKSIIRPYVQAEVKLFLDTIMREFREGYIIWGNHDQDNKSEDQDFIDSCLAVMLPPNLHYADKKELIIDNSRIAFYNWRPEFDLSWIQGCVDLLITHATISYSGDDQYKSQVLDQSKFSLAICGDIHKPASIGKYVSIGVPQRCKMSDSEYSTGVIYDCVNKTWKHVNLNPHDNLMKFKYVPDLKDEGWDESIGTWKIYKPDNLGISSLGVRNINVPAWDEIGKLIDDIIVTNGLTPVHQEILKNLRNSEIKEVDFNFVLKRLYCKNWRSIDEAELFFDDMDKILIVGENGSGKSSLLSALKYAFIDCNASLKDFRQFGTKSCTTEVDFLYQGKYYRIHRGWKSGKPTFGLLVDNVPMKYNNKKEFDEDMHIRFPFIDYMDVFFFNSDHNKLIGDITPERKSELISKFYKMDKIDSYNEAAEFLMDKMKDNAQQWKKEIEESEKVLGYIESRLGLLQLPGNSLEELLSLKNEGLRLQEAAKKWAEYETMSSNLRGRLKVYTETKADLEEKIKFLRDPNTIEEEIREIKNKISEISSSILSLKVIDTEFNLKKSTLGDINSEGNRLYLEWQNLGKTRVCPTCKQEIKSGNDLVEHKAELEKKLTELTERKNQITAELQDLYNRKQDSDSAISVLNKDLEILHGEVASKTAEISRGDNLRKQLEDTTRNIESCNLELSRLKSPEEVKLPDNFMEMMGSIESGITIWNTYNSLLNDRSEVLEKMAKCTKELETLKQGVQELESYIKLTGPTGKIYEEVMNRLAKQFTDNKVMYEVETYRYRGKDHLDLKSSYLNNGNWVEYEACSDGQKTVLDINFLSKIVTRMGLLVMDEFLKHLDPKNHESCIEMISGMNIGCIMISSHMESISQFNNKTCRLKLNDSAVTSVTLI